MSKRDDYIKSVDGEAHNSAVEIIEALESHLKTAVDALERIANQDYRGNRCICSVEAFKTLTKIKGEKEG